MRWLLIAAIRLYQQTPYRHRRECIFEETCSRHVLRITRESGFIAGIRALRLRTRQCRPIRSMEFADSSCVVVALADGTLVDISLLSARLRSMYAAVHRGGDQAGIEEAV